MPKKFRCYETKNKNTNISAIFAILLFHKYMPLKGNTGPVTTVNTPLGVNGCSI